MGVGSHEQVLHFTHNRISELSAASREATDEQAMWRAVAQRADLSDALRSFVLRRIADIGGRLAVLDDERMLYDEILSLLNPCPACNGYGEIREYIAQDESNLRMCTACMGSGTKAA
jgi:hypothetical protein